MKSLDVNVNDATIVISEMTTAEEIEAYIEGDSRKTVTDAADKRLDALTRPTPPAGQNPPAVEDPRVFEKPYSTIMIPKGSEKNDQRTVTVNITGTLPDGSNYEFRRVFRRGMKEHNVPANVIQALNDAIITEYTSEEKADGTGNQLVSETKPRWTAQILKQYNTKMTEEQVAADLGIK
jgi:hypothetical protein